MAGEPLNSDVTYSGLNQQALVAVLKNMQATINELRTGHDALVADMATRIANHNTLKTKLNADAGVTDADYAAAGAITAVVLTSAAVAIALTKT